MITMLESIEENKNYVLSDLMDELVSKNKEKLDLRNHSYFLFLKDGFLYVYLSEENEIMAKIQIIDKYQVMYSNEKKVNEDVVIYHKQKVDDSLLLEIINKEKLQTFHSSHYIKNFVDTALKKSEQGKLKPINIERKSRSWKKSNLWDDLFSNIGISDIVLVPIFFILLLYVIQLYI